MWVQVPRFRLGSAVFRILNAPQSQTRALLSGSSECALHLHKAMGVWCTESLLGSNMYLCPTVTLSQRPVSMLNSARVCLDGNSSLSPILPHHPSRDHVGLRPLLPPSKTAVAASPTSPLCTAGRALPARPPLYTRRHRHQLQPGQRRAGQAAGRGQAAWHRAREMRNIGRTATLAGKEAALAAKLSLQGWRMSQTPCRRGCKRQLVWWPVALQPPHRCSFCS